MATKPNTTNGARCLECGQPLRGESLEGFCPRCLSRVAFDADSESGGSANALSLSVADYELVKEIGRGGMGVVWKARQRSLDRIVALKFILTGSFASREFIDRFRAEASAAARLKHPNIVAVHEVGEHEGHHYFSMDFIDGRNLTQLVRDEPPSLRQAARYLRLIADAIHHAHERGIVHRDLKPSNILVDNAGEPHITDFGLARELNSDEHLTLTGQALGSPSFAAPEQIGGGLLSSAAARPLADAKPEAGSQSTSHAAANRETRAPLTQSADIYGLGAILYYLLTGRAPFVGLTLANILRAVQEDEPVSPRVLNPEIPHDLETICLKCLEKEPSRRYATAKELGDELGRFLNDEPVHARPVSRTEKVWRWCRRKPALATLGVLVIVLLLAVLIGAPIMIVRIDRARLEAERNLYAADMRLASEALRNGEIGQVQELLRAHERGKGAEDLRGFEWRYLRQAADQSGLVPHQLQGVKYSRSLVLTAGTLYNLREDTGEILAWDTAAWAPLSLKLPPQRASERWWWRPRQQAALAVNDKDRTIAVYRLPGFEEVSVIPVPGRAATAAVSEDLRTLAVAFQDGGIYRILVWDLAANSQRWVFGEYRGQVTYLGFSPDNSVLAAACDDGEIGLWSITDGKALSSPARDFSTAKQDWSKPWNTPPFFGPSSARLYLNRGRDRKALEVWDWSTGKLSILYKAHHGGFKAFGVSPDGAVLATAGLDGVIALLDTKECRQVGAMPANGALILCLAFSPSGSLIASGSRDRSAKLWDVKTHLELATLGGNDDQVAAVAFTPDENSVVTLCFDGSLKVWDLRAVLHRDVLWSTTNVIEGLTLSADERAIATADDAGGIDVWDQVSGRLIRSIQTDDAPHPVAISSSPTDHIVGWGGPRSIGILDYESGQTSTFPISRADGFCNPAFSPDGRELAFVDSTNIMLLDMATRRPRPFVAVDNGALALAFSPNGSLLASTHYDGSLTLWDSASGRAITTNILAHPPIALDVEFSPDGRLLGSGGWDATCKLWDVVPGGLKLRNTLRGHVGSTSLIFSLDGRRVVSSSAGDSTLKLWDTQTGLEVGRLYGHRGGVAGFAFSRDGNTIYSAGTGGDVRVWRAPPLDELKAAGTKKASGTPEPHPNLKNR
jgi:WD40 repeat protein/serine/threonine protein kinase